jgi:hypothetical protein
VDELVRRVDVDQGLTGAIERASRVSKAVVLSYAERLQSRLPEADRALLASIERPLRPAGPSLERCPDARR